MVVRGEESHNESGQTEIKGASGVLKTQFKCSKDNTADVWGCYSTVLKLSLETAKRSLRIEYSNKMYKLSLMVLNYRSRKELGKLNVIDKTNSIYRKNADYLPKVTLLIVILEHLDINFEHVKE